MKSVVKLSASCLFLLLAACGGSKSSAPAAAAPSLDTSTSGSAVAAVSGAYSGSTASGDQARRQNDLQKVLAILNPLPSADASNACPTFSSVSLSSCLASDTLSYSSCSFGGSSAVWNGGVTFSCTGTFANGTVTRAVSNNTTRTNAYGNTLTINTSSLSTFDGSSVTGGGTEITVSGGAVTAISLHGVEMKDYSGQREVFDHTTTGSLSQSGGVYSGSVTTYHNLVHVIATSTLSNLTFSSDCCYPVSGTVTTSFAASANTSYPPLLSGFVGATESLQITGCGTATYTGPEGYSGSVVLANCI